MLQSEKDAERYYQAQARFEQRQRMIDKGWDDKEEYNKVVALQKRKSTLKSLKECLLGGLLGGAIAVVVVYVYGLRIGVYHL